MRFVSSHIKHMRHFNFFKWIFFCYLNARGRVGERERDRKLKTIVSFLSSGCCDGVVDDVENENKWRQNAKNNREKKSIKSVQCIRKERKLSGAKINGRLMTSVNWLPM